MIEITAAEYNHIDIAPSPQNDTNSLRVLKRHNIDETKFFDIVENNNAYFLITEKLPALKAIYPILKDLITIAGRALEVDYVNRISTRYEDRVFKESLPRNSVRDGAIRAPMLAAIESVRVLDAVIPKLEESLKEAE